MLNDDSVEVPYHVFYSFKLVVTVTVFDKGSVGMVCFLDPVYTSADPI